ncbi:MAG: hypothetical protein ABIE22_00260 [archaeon]
MAADSYDSGTMGILGSISRENIFPYIAREFISGLPKDVAPSMQGKVGFDIVKEGALKTLFKFEGVYDREAFDERGEGVLRLIFKYWWPNERMEGMPDGFIMGNGDVAPWEVERRQYQFLGGIAGVPKARHITEVLRNQGIPEEKIGKIAESVPYLNRAMIFEYFDFETLESIMGDMQDVPEKRKRIIGDSLDSVIAFQNQASNKLKRSGNGDAVNILYHERDLSTKAMLYAAALLGLENPDQVPKKVQDDLMAGLRPVRRFYYSDEGEQGARTLVPPVVCHGDLNLSNIACTDLTDNGKGSHILFDPKIRVNDGITDIGCMLASYGVALGPRDWHEIGREYREKQYRKFGATDQESTFGKWVNKWFNVKSGGMGVSDEILIHDRAALDLNILWNSYRNLAKHTIMQRFFPEHYGKILKSRPLLASAEEQMPRNIDYAIDDLMKNASKLGVGREIDDFHRLSLAFGEMGILPSSQTSYEGFGNYRVGRAKAAEA